MGFLDTFCISEETKDINKKLKDLYGVWYRGLKIDGSDDLQLNGKSLNPLSLLTCTDSYLKKRVMVFGQEAHDTKNEMTICNKPEDYFLSAFHYDIAIHECKAPRTLFLKQRILLANLDKNINMAFTTAEKQMFQGILINNLNKTSYAGDHLGVKKNGLLAEIYKPFEYDGILSTILEHELIILRPRKIVFLTGKGYWPHMKRDFQTVFPDGSMEKRKFFEAENSLQLSSKPVSDAIEFKYDSSSQKNVCKAVVCYHPNARMKIDVRKEYDKVMLDFVNS